MSGIRLLAAAAAGAPKADAARVAEVQLSSPWMEPAADANRLTTSCLVNNFNYGRYVVDAVRSALDQDHPFDQVVVVDDGSTDDSLSRLHDAFAGEERLVVVEQENQGQLSCFQNGFAKAGGNLIFFLDADDVYERNYLATMYEVYLRHRTYHCAVSAYRLFGGESRDVRRFSEDRDLGFSAVLALSRSLVKLSVSPTSTLSMRRSVLEKIFPLEQLEDWRSRADDCLLFGASLAGARKFYSSRPLVGYRVHGENAWYGRTFDRDYDEAREGAIDRLFASLLERLELHGLGEWAGREFIRNGSPDLRRFRHYARLAWRSEGSMPERLGMLASMGAHLCRPGFFRGGGSARMGGGSSSGRGTPCL